MLHRQRLLGQSEPGEAPHSIFLLKSHEAHKHNKGLDEVLQLGKKKKTQPTQSMIF